ncbi:hypothetical protein G4Y79_10945 [Phototrophicus methaneseepsis]|uniref:histidine kinase n=1 Tax=Phototrophicus methaneseepsis TaxID=2710758 RepID=A0A7S8EDA5_9CHLR|nr:ATP-binding protein [Phototrophicus methaneseepsis]QPC84857.1 hypothetical protein G4Y79_10945 [Phototrophicus methaneseepsis]
MADVLDLQLVLDGIGHAVLIFAADGRLILHNRAAGTLLGNDLRVIRSEGWPLAEALFDTGIVEDENKLAAVRKRMLQAVEPQRFHIFRSGEYIPCWASSVVGADGSIYTMLTLDVADWGAVGQVLGRFRDEMRESVSTTIGHIDLIQRTLSQHAENGDGAEARIARRIGGFTRLIANHMSRADRFMMLLERLESLRTGEIRQIIRQDRRKIDFIDFMEDFMEALYETRLLDPETENQADYLARIELELPDELVIKGVPRYVRYALQELLRNAIMYSLAGTPIRVRARTRQTTAQIEVIDEGYGIRESEWLRVFNPFERARQPQIISEFGYGLCLYLCKHEIEAMNGQLWFTSEENVGTTFCINLPLWSSSSSYSSDNEP